MLTGASAPAAVDAAPAAPAVSVVGLSKRFGDRVAFDDVSFEVGRGEVFGFLGPNGAGKTTTVRTLGTLIAPTSGSATVAGHPAHARERRGDPPADRDHAGVAGPLPAPERRSRTSSASPTSTRCPTPRERIERALCEAVNLADRADDACGTLSKGLRQRVALARALLSDPEVLFLDEPTSGLDPVAAREVHELIDGLRERGVTIFLTTHRLEEAERLCDRVAILNTTLRTIGRPERAARPAVREDARRSGPLAPLPTRTASSAACPAVDGWRQDGPATYVLDRVRPGCRRAGGDPGAGRRRRRRAVDQRVAALARGRLPRADRRGRGGGPTHEHEPQARPGHRPQGAARVPAQPLRRRGRWRSSR